MRRETEKRAPSREDFLAPAVWKQHWTRMNTRPQIRMGIVVHVWQQPHVYDTRMANWYIDNKVFSAILAAQIANGSIVTMQGEEIRDISPDLGAVHGRTYYMLASRAQALREEQALRVLEARTRKAEAHARAELVKRHREEYDGILLQCFKELKEAGE